MHRSLERRLAALEQATVPPDERPMITVVVYDEPLDRVVRTVDVPMGTPGGELDYREKSPGISARRTMRETHPETRNYRARCARAGFGGSHVSSW